MAQVAQGVNCPDCSTLVTCAGALADETLVGKCPCCRVTVTVTNFSHVATVRAETEAAPEAPSDLPPQEAPPEPEAAEPTEPEPQPEQPPESEPVNAEAANQ